MKLEYTTPEIEVTLFATTSIMDSEVSLPVEDKEPGTISGSTWLD